MSLALVASSASAQGRGGAIWNTAGADAQRSSAMRTDVRISKDSMGKPGFQLLWKRQLETRPKGNVALTQPVFSSPGFITHKGFKGLAFLGGVSDTIYAVDYDLNKMFWTTKLSTAATSGGSTACPGGLTAITETAQLGAPPAPAARGAAPAPGVPPAGGGGGGGRGGGRGAVAGLYAVSSGGMLHNVNFMVGTDWFPPARLLPAANAKVTGAILANSVMYVSTTDTCGGVPNGVYAMDLTPVPAPTTDARGLPIAPVATPASTAVARWESKGGGVVGVGPAIASDGTLFVATGDGEYSATAFSDAVVALEAKTLNQKDYFTPGKTPFTTSPVVFQFQDKELVAAANLNGGIYILDATSLGGADHKTPLAATSQTGGTIGGLATFASADGTRWLLAAISGNPGMLWPNGIVALKLTTQAGVLSIERGWESPNMTTPVTPAVVNGVVFALSSGERAPRSDNAVLYALDATTGRQLWNSGTTITSPVHRIGPAANDGQVYVVTTDGTLYTFGFVVER